MDPNVMLQIMPLFADPRVVINATADVAVPAEMYGAFRQLFAGNFEEVEENVFRLDSDQDGTTLRIHLVQQVPESAESPTEVV